MVYFVGAVEVQQLLRLMWLLPPQNILHML
jgi:hypothetical protein